MERQNMQLAAKVAELERVMDAKQRDALINEDVIARYGESLKELEAQFEVKEREYQHIRE